MRLDHVIYGTSDLDAATAMVETELGLPVLPGGHHEGQGSHNRIVPLGGGYLELMAIDDPEEAATSEIGRALLDMLAGERLCAYAVFVDDLHAHAERLGLELHTVRRGGLEAYVTGAPRRCASRSCRSSSAPTAAARAPATRATPAASPGSRSPATRHAWSSGSAVPNCRCAWSKARRPCERSGSATASSAPLASRIIG